MYERSKDIFNDAKAAKAVKAVKAVYASLEGFRIKGAIAFEC